MMSCLAASSSKLSGTVGSVPSICSSIDCMVERLGPFGSWCMSPPARRQRRLLFLLFALAVLEHPRQRSLLGGFGCDQRALRLAGMVEPQPDQRQRVYEVVMDARGELYHLIVGFRPPRGEDGEKNPLLGNPPRNALRTLFLVSRRHQFVERAEHPLFEHPLSEERPDALQDMVFFAEPEYRVVFFHHLDHHFDDRRSV